MPKIFRSTVFLRVSLVALLTYASSRIRIAARRCESHKFWSISFAALCGLACRLALAGVMAIAPMSYAQTTPKCGVNKGATSQAQCRLDSPTNFHLDWAPLAALAQATKATVYIFDKYDPDGSGTGRGCSGTLVSTVPETRFTYVLTAAHCFKSQPDTSSGPNVSVLLDTNYRTDTCNSATLSTAASFTSTAAGRLVHIDRARDTALILLESQIDIKLRSDSQTATARVDPGDFLIQQAYFNAHHPSGSDLRLHSGEVTNGSVTGSWAPPRSTLGQILSDGVKVTWRDGASEPQSSGSGLFTIGDGQLIVKGTATYASRGFGAEESDFYCSVISSDWTVFAKVKNSYSLLRPYLEPTSRIAVQLSGNVLSDASLIQLHAESGSLVREQSHSPTLTSTTLADIPTGTYYVDVYGWDMRIATSVAALTAHDRNACTGGIYDCRTISSMITPTAQTKKPLTITVTDSSGTIVSGAVVVLESINGQTGASTQRASGTTSANGTFTFQAWPTTLPGEKYRVRASSGLGSVTAEGVRVDPTSGGSVLVKYPSSGAVASQTPTIASVTTTPPNGCDVTNSNRGFVTLTGSNFTSSSQITLSDGTTNYAIPTNRTTMLSASQVRACANLYYTLNWTASVTNGGTPSNTFSFTVNTTTGTSCSPTFAASVATFAAAANTGSVDVLAGSACAWTASSSNTAWLTISQGATGTGNGRVYYSLTNNTGSLRGANIALNSGAVHTVTQSASTTTGGIANCTYSVYPTSLPTANAGGDTITFNVSTQPGCTWTATTDTAWASVLTSYFSGSGSTAVSLLANAASSTRSVNALVAGVTVPIVQAGTVVPTSGSIQVFIDPPAAIAAGGQWGSADYTGYVNSGATVTGLSLGATHCVTVKPIGGWTSLNVPCYTLAASNPTVSTTLTMYRQNPVVLSGASVLAPIAIFAGQTVEIKADAYWTNSALESITPVWTASNPSILVDRGGGFFSVPSSLAADASVSLTASYTLAGITRTDTKKIAVLKRIVSSGAKVAQGQTRKLATGGDHSLAVRDDGTVWAWGSNTVGQLGNGSLTNSASPSQVIGLADVRAVEAAGRSSFALKADGTVWAWGFNGNGELGDGTTIDRTSPVRVLNITDVRSICSSGPVYFAVKNDGTLWGWGSTSSFYQLLLLGTTPSNYWSPPIQITQLGSDVSEACPTAEAAIAVKTNGSAYRWGVWQRNTPQEERITTPSLLAGFEGAGSISALYGDAAFATATGDLRVYGQNRGYSLATYYSDRVQRHLSPAAANFGFDGVSAVAIGNGVGTVLLNDGRVVGIGSSWGPNLQVDQFVPDQVGRFLPGQIAYYVPTVYSGLSNIVSLPRLQSLHGLALRQDGCVMSWGYNVSGQTGQGAPTAGYSPVSTVIDPAGGCFKLTNVYQIAANPANGSLGVATGAGTYPLFQPLRVSAIPAAGYAFTGWTESSVVVSNQADYDFVVSGNRSLVANFGCDYKLGSYITSFLRPGGTSSSVSVSVGSGCAWTPSSTAPWLQALSSGATGNGAFTFSVQPNTSGYARTGSIAVGSQSILVLQAAGCSLDVNGDSQVNASSDAVLLLRYLLGFRGDALIAGVALGSRDTATKIEEFLGSGSQFDVFGRSPPAPIATADGLVLSRLILGVPDTTLLNGVPVPVDALHATASAVRANVNVQCGTLY